MLKRIKFTIQTVGKSTEKTILLRVFLENGVVSMSTGYSVLPSCWISGTYRVKWGFVSQKRQTAREINNGLDKFQEVAEKTCAFFDETGESPTTSQWRDQFRILSGLSIENGKSVTELFSQYEQEKGLERGWSKVNYTRNEDVLRHILKFRPNVKVKHFSKQWFTSFHEHLIEEGLKNPTIRRILTFTKAFVNWLSDNDLIEDRSFKTYHPRIKMVQNRTVVYLEEEELKRMIDLKIPENNAYLDRVRDAFVFGCFTGMRYSDIRNLKKSDIYKGAIHFTTEKTDKVIEVELNDMSRSILEKYKDDGKPNALPVPVNQDVNRWIKDVAQMSQINQPVTNEYFIGSEKHTETKEKWELISFHASRRTFCSMCAMHGISVETIMKWTGHASVNEMKPYLELAKKYRQQEMKKMNFITK